MKEWLSANTEKLIEERRDIKQQINCCKNQEQKKILQTTYTGTDKKVKKSARKDKRAFQDALAKEAEKAAEKKRP